MVLWGLVYALCVAVLVVRVRTVGTPVPAPVAPSPGEPLWLTRVHHGLFFCLIAGAPIDALLMRPGAGPGRPAGALLLAAGVLLYRWAGRSLGDALSPFVQPRPGAALVTGGLYRHLRHPMYLGEAMIALGAPLLLASRHVAWLAGPAVAVLLVRIAREEQALARTFPEYPGYAARTSRVLPFLY